MTYVLKDIFLARQFINGMWDSEDKARFEDFKQDLGAIGFHLDDYRVIPSVGGGIEEEIAMFDELNSLLHRINPEFPKMRDGAWETYLSRSPDGDRQAISSIRELFDHVVDSLSDKPTWKEKVASIVGGQDAEVISSSADLAKAMYGLQSKGTHKEPSYPRAFFAMKMTEYSLHYLLRSYLDRKK
jgi:hypothetical protein